MELDEHSPHLDILIEELKMFSYFWYACLDLH